MTELTQQINSLIEIDHGQMAGDSSLADTSLKQEYIDQFIGQWIQVMLSVDVDDSTVIHQIKNALFDLGEKEQKEFWMLSDNFKGPLQHLMSDSHSSEKINTALRDLQQKISDLKPPNKNKGGLKTMFLLLFSWKQTAWQLWLENYQQFKTEVVAATKVLTAEKAQLNRNNLMLSDKYSELKSSLKNIEHAVDLSNLLVQGIQKYIDSHKDSSQAMSGVLESEFMPVVQQRVIDLQQQLLIGRQTLMTIDLITKQNESQSRSIDQTVQNTTSALDVTAGLVLAEQGRLALDEHGQVGDAGEGKKSPHTQELKQVQLRIEQTLQQIDGARKATGQVISTNK